MSGARLFWNSRSSACRTTLATNTSSVLTTGKMKQRICRRSDQKLLDALWRPGPQHGMRYAFCRLILHNFSIARSLLRIGGTHVQMLVPRQDQLHLLPSRCRPQRSWCWRGTSFRVLVEPFVWIGDRGWCFWDGPAKVSCSQFLDT